MFESDYEGGIRVDANISFPGYNRVEIKNISSYKGVEKALLYEIKRQKNLIKKNELIYRETRHYNEDTGITTSGRSKETAMDYRYFPEPDLLSIKVKDWVDNIILPELPDAHSNRFMLQYNISKSHADVLSSNFKLANFYERAALINPYISSIWLVDVLIGELKFRNISINDILKYDKLIIEWIQLLNDKSITDRAAIIIIRTILDQILTLKNVETPNEIVTKLNLKKESVDLFYKIITNILSTNEKAISDHLSGKKGALNYIIGQVMKETNGKADPNEIKEIINTIIMK